MVEFAETWQGSVVLMFCAGRSVSRFISGVLPKERVVNNKGVLVHEFREPVAVVLRVGGRRLIARVVSKGLGADARRVVGESPDESCFKVPCKYVPLGPKAA